MLPFVTECDYQEQKLRKVLIHFNIFPVTEISPDSFPQVFKGLCHINVRLREGVHNNNPPKTFPAATCASLCQSNDPGMTTSPSSP
jgi:hypothetical protein